MSEGAMDVWLAEKLATGPAVTLGIFSTPDKAQGICQDNANEYFGAASTPALEWRGRDGHSSASHHHPVRRDVPVSGHPVCSGQGAGRDEEIVSEKLSAEHLQEIAAMNARTYAMTEEDRERCNA